MKKLVETNAYQEITLDFIIDFFMERSNVYPEMRQQLIDLSKKENGVPGIYLNSHLKEMEKKFDLN